MFRIDLIVRPRHGVRDPQGEAVEEALRGVGYTHQSMKVHCVGRYLQMDIEAKDQTAAHNMAEEMCKRLLVNPNLETYSITVSKLA